MSSSKAEPPATLEDILSRLRQDTDGQQQVSIADLLDAIGERSFGPVALIAGLVILAPLIGDIPGVPTLFGLVVLLTLGQLLFQRRSIWLPSPLANRKIERDTLLKGLDWVQKPAYYLDRWTKPRLSWLVHGPGRFLMAVICMAVAAAMPAMEVVPFSANGGGLALFVFGLALVAGDGLLALIGITITATTLWLLVSNLAG